MSNEAVSPFGLGSTADGWQRLHPATILESIVSNSLNLVLGLLFLFGRGGANWRDSVDLLIGVLLIGPPLITYLTSRYRIDDTSVYWRRGLLIRQRRELPRDRIQSVETSIGFIGRVFGLETLTVSTAGGGTSEITLGLIDQETSSRIRRQLTPGPDLPPPTWDPSTTTPPTPSMPTDVGYVYAELTTNDLARVALTNLVRRAPRMCHRSNGLRSVRLGDRLRTTRGLLRVDIQETSRSRIQGLRRRQSLIARTMGLEEVSVDTADVSGHGANASLLLNPIAPSGRWEDFGRDLLDLRLVESDLGPVSPRGLRRLQAQAVRRSAGLALLGVLIGLAVAPSGARPAVWIALIAVILLESTAGQWCARRSFTNHRYALDTAHLAVQQGCLTTTLIAVPRSSTQSVTIRSNWFQRRLELATVRVDNPTLSIGGVSIVDVSATEAGRLTADLLSGFVRRPV